MDKRTNRTNESVAIQIRIIEAEVKPDVIIALQQRRRSLLAQIAIRYAGQLNKKNQK